MSLREIKDAYRKKVRYEQLARDARGDLRDLLERERKRDLKAAARKAAKK